MKIRWLGHSAFLITTDSGTRIITDPYNSNAYQGVMDYGPIDEPADVVLMSHEHEDHGYFRDIPGNPMLIRGAGEFVAAGMHFYGIETFHDTEEGSKRGKNVVYCFTADDIKVCHLGDLGHTLTSEQAVSIGTVDVLLTPVGGFYTIGPEEATQITDQLSARIVIPMHFKTDKCAFPIAGVDEFLKDKPRVEKPGKSELEITRDEIPEEKTVVVLDHAL
jgi:L-ascorbate metabolism protein UlaG (beta-lactamase superfamily)